MTACSKYYHVYIEDDAFVLDLVVAVHRFQQHLRDHLRKLLIVLGHVGDDGGEQTDIQFVLHHLPIETALV